MKNVGQGIKELRLLGYALWIEDDRLMYRRVHKFPLDSVDVVLTDNLISFIKNNKSWARECLREEIESTHTQLTLSNPSSFKAMFQEACEDINKRYLNAGITNDTVSSFSAYIEEDYPGLAAIIAEKEGILDTLWREGKDRERFKKVLILWHTLRLQELKAYT